MGYDLLFIRRAPDGTEDRTFEEPDAFSPRYAGRQHWLSAMWDIPNEKFYYCGCCKEQPDGTMQFGYYCADPSATRPKDFNEFREKLKAAGLWHRPFRAMTRWLERNPDVFVSFSN